MSRAILRNSSIFVSGRLRSVDGVGAEKEEEEEDEAVEALPLEAGFDISIAAFVIESETLKGCPPDILGKLFLTSCC